MTAIRLHCTHGTQIALAEERVRSSTVRSGSTCPHGNRSFGLALPGCCDADARALPLDLMVSQLEDARAV
jgi:hypothetical protein